MDHEKLDRIVAEKVMGYHWCLWRKTRTRVLAYPELDDLEPAKGDEPLNPKAYELVLNYSSSMMHAWQVVERVLGGENAYEFAIALMESCGAIQHLAGAPVNLVLRILNYLTPRHICLAALKAHGVDVSEFEKEAAQ